MSSKAVLTPKAVFPAIDSAATKIRLIELHPGGFESSIIFECHVITLDGQHQPYEALSYTWGDAHANDKEIISVGETDVSVTGNLAHALRALRHKDAKRWLWIDAVCINQNDDGEKTAQVNMMRRIYRGYSQCDIWLGTLNGLPVQNMEDTMEEISWMAREKPRPA